jgi:branched-chain amino acid transport system permease protein
MLDPIILLPAIVNGLTMGAVYALVALGLTLIYGVLHIINFAHGSLLMVGLYGTYLLHRVGIDPYVALVVMVPALFLLGYVLQWSVIGRASHGSDQNVLLVTLGASIVIENFALYVFTADTHTVETPYAAQMIDLDIALVPLPRLIAFGAALALAALLWFLIARTDLGRAIRAVAKERQGARLVGIDVDHIFAMSFGIGTACLGAVFVLVAFTVVVLGGMGSFSGALFGGLLIGVTESVGGLLLGESLGQIGIFLIFIATLMFRPSGLFGSRLS